LAAALDGATRKALQASNAIDLFAKPLIGPSCAAASELVPMAFAAGDESYHRQAIQLNQSGNSATLPRSLFCTNSIRKEAKL
jgi:hypothetical protein